MFGVPIPPHVYVTLPRVLVALLTGNDDAVPSLSETEVPDARVIDIDEWLQKWRAHPDVEPETWETAKDRVYAAKHLRFLRWAVRAGRVNEGRLNDGGLL